MNTSNIIYFIICAATLVILLFVIPYTIINMDVNETQWKQYIQDHPNWSIQLDDGDYQPQLLKLLSVVVILTIVTSLVVFYFIVDR
jgi:hypothetical protein